MVSESFDCHPGFQLPTDCYTLDLNKPSPQPQEFQVFMEALRKSLKSEPPSLYTIAHLRAYVYVMQTYTVACIHNIIFICIVQSTYVRTYTVTY